MVFSDGADEGAGGFLSLFGSDAGTDSPSDAYLDSSTQDDATAADTDSPETDDGQELSAEDVVAARLAASLEADGFEIPDPDAGTEDETEPVAGALDLDSLTAEELRALAEEAIALKAREAQDSEETRKQTVRQKVEAAEADAIAWVDQQFEAEVLSKSRNHFNAQLNQRIANIVKASRNQDDPDQFVIQHVIAEANAVFAKKEEWEAEQANSAAWAQRVQDARLAARQSVPEAREYVARALAAKYGLPEGAVADIAHPNRHMTNFEQRAQELAGLVAARVADGKKTAQTKRQDANRRLQEQPIRTSSTGRQPGGKPPQYTDAPEEGLALIKLLRAG
jgi:hypothetical protein